MIDIRILGFFQEYTGKNFIQIEYRKGLTVGEAIKQLSQELYDYIKNHMENAVILVNGVSINNLKGLDTRLRDGDRLALMPVVGGGSPPLNPPKIVIHTLNTYLNLITTQTYSSIEHTHMPRVLILLNKDSISLINRQTIPIKFI